MPDYKNFSNCPFKPMQVSLDLSNDHAVCKISIKSQTDDPSFCVAVSEITLVDKLGRTAKYDSGLLMKKPLVQYSFFISYGIIKLLKKDIKYSIVFLTPSVKYTAYYDTEGDKKILKKLMADPMSDIDKEFLSRLTSPSADTFPGPDTGTDDIFTSPALSKYVSAASIEMNYLKTVGGRRYKVSYGVLLGHKNGVFSYLFQLESELYISDDSPVKVEIPKLASFDGTVLLSEDFQIIIQLKTYLGDTVNYAHIIVEPWKLLEALITRLGSIYKGKHKLTVSLIDEGPKNSTTIDIQSVDKGQDKAILRAETEPVLVIWGPPGTGKTYTMAQIAIRHMKAGEKVLIVSHSNVSVDGVIKKIVEQLDDRDGLAYLKSGNVLRYGIVRDPALSEHPYATSFNYTTGKIPYLARRRDELLERKKELKRKDKSMSQERVQLEEELREIRKKIKDNETLYVKQARILATTISKVVIDSLFDDAAYDVVMFDEASMAYSPQIFAASMLARKHFICVGDFQQLAPIAQSPTAAETLKKDIYSFLKIRGSSGKIYYHPWLVMLDEQRRMHPDIAAFSNYYIYKGLLKNHPSVLTGRNLIVGGDPLPGHAMNLIDLSGTYAAAQKNEDNSRFNILSAVLSFQTAVNAEKNGIDSVGIIAPYAAQVRLIRAMIQDYRNSGKATNLVSATVHQFQGSESDVIVFDMVEGFPFSKPGWLTSKNDNGAVTRLVNVAVTRARGKFIAVADDRFWNTKFEDSDPNNMLYRLTSYMKAKAHHVRHKDGLLEDHVSDIDASPVVKTWIAETDLQLNDLLKRILKDISSAKDRIAISIPDGQMSNKTFSSFNNTIILAIDEAKSRGIHIYMKSNSVDLLPADWKKYCNETKNAYFPLIMIDERVTWYGIPITRGMLKSNKSSSSYNTISNIIARITGEHSIEMILSLTDLMSVDDGKNKYPLTEKYFERYDILPTTKIRPPLSAYVAQNLYCDDCHTPMLMLKSKKGSVYLKCPKCADMQYMDPDFVNQYIKKYSLTCPQDKGSIFCGLGKYGLYVKCSNNHFLSPDEI